MDLRFRIVAWAAILAALLEIPLSASSFLLGYFLAWDSSLALTLNTIYYVLLPILSLLFIVIAFGFFLLAKKENKTFLLVMSIVGMVYSIIFYLLMLASTRVDEGFLTSMLGAIVVSVVAGIITILFGIAVLQLKKSYPLAKALGVLNIINGCLALTLVFIFFSPLVATAIHVIEAIFFFRIASK